MGFTFAQSGIVTLVIDGKEYQGAVDGPAFVDFWRANHSKLDKMADESNADMGRDAVAFCVSFVTALLGAEASKEIFDGKVLSLMDCVALIGYIMGEIGAQGVDERLANATAKYSATEILR